MREALRRLSSITASGFHRSGIYCFWDPDTSDILYLGLATTLSERFAQHTALSDRSARGNKRKQIKEWFESHDRLGYSILIQSAFVEGFSDGGDTPQSIVATGEGQLIDAYVKQFGTLPLWNRIGGSVDGAAWSGPLTPGYFRLLTGQSDGLIVSRRSIRDLSADDDAIDHEMTLHGARMNALHRFGMGSGAGDEEILAALEQLRVNPMFDGDRQAIDRLIGSGYLYEPAAHPEELAPCEGGDAPTTYAS